MNMDKEMADQLAQAEGTLGAAEDPAPVQSIAPKVVASIQITKDSTGNLQMSMTGPDPDLLGMLEYGRLVMEKKIGPTIQIDGQLKA